MPRKVPFLQVRAHLEYVQQTIELVQKYGMCPLSVSELAKVSLLTRAILRKDDERRAKGNRKDIYIEKAAAVQIPR